MKPCTCSAYPFPHRPGSGRCQYDDAAALMSEMYGYDLTVAEYADNDQEDAAAPDLLAVCEQMYRAMMAIGNDLNWDMSDCGYAPPECPQMFPVSFVEAMNVGKAAIAAAKGEVS